MKILLAVIIIVIVAASLFADYGWRRWMTARRREHDDGAEKSR